MFSESRLVFRSFEGHTEEDFHNRPIHLPVLGTTGKPKGDDSGYRDPKNVRIEESNERVVPLNNYVMVRAFYDGVSPYTGERDESLVLPGGTGDKMYARETVAIAAEATDKYARETYGSDVGIGVIDAFRSYKRQAADFTRQLIIELKGDTSPDARKLLDVGNYTDLTVSFVNPDTESSEYKDALRDVLANTEIMGALEDTVQALYEKNARTGASLNRDDAKAEIAKQLLTICANVACVKDFFGEKAPKLPVDRSIPLNYAYSAHAGAAALDNFVYVGGKPIAHVPYNQTGPVAARDFLEHDANIAGFQLQLKNDPLLRQHITRLNFSPDLFLSSDWDFFRTIQRIRHGIMEAMGATFYSSSDAAASNPYNYVDPVDGGEVWHDEHSNTPMDPRTGKVIHRGGLADKYPQSGNPGHALQTMGRGRAVAVWGGIGAHQQLRELGVLDA